MIKKFIKVFSVLLLVGFSFFYTEKVSKIVREKDPIMIKINKIDKNKNIEIIKPIVYDDEYVMGINGCKIDKEKSYNKMKTFGEYNDELLVMKEVSDNYNLSNKYIIGGNKLEKKVSIIFLIRDNINQKLNDYLTYKKIKANYFVNQDYLEKNIIEIKMLSENNNIYYFGNSGKYEDKYMLYSNNLIDINTNNKSEYCLTNIKDNDILNICKSYNMKTIKMNYINEDILSNVKKSLNNGSIIVIDSNDIDSIKVSLNYITYRGYNIVLLDELLNKNRCNKKEN